MSLRVGALTIFPMKSGAPRPVDRARVTRIGLAGDRELMVVDERGEFVTQREHPELALVEVDVEGDLVRARLPSGDEARAEVGPRRPTRDVRVWRSDCRALDAGDELAALIGGYLRREVRVVRLDPSFERVVNDRYGAPGDVVSFADGYPLLVVTTASLEDLNARLEAPVTIGRFRANLVVEGAEAFDEDRWRHLEVGAVRFDVVKPCARCVMVNVDPKTGASSPEVLKTLGRYRLGELGVIFGQNLVPRALGEIGVGDEVVVG